MNLPSLIRQLDVPQIVMATVVAVSLLGFLSERIKRALVLTPFLVRRGQWYRLLTAGWVHSDVMHLVTNLFVLWFFSRRVLVTFGPLRYVALYVTAVVVAYLPTTVRYRNVPQYNSLGASGAVAAVMLSAIMLEPTAQLRLFFFPVAIPGVVFGFLYIVYSVWHSWSARDRINHDAHFSGALYGALVTWIWAPDKVAQSINVLRRYLGV